MLAAVAGVALALQVGISAPPSEGPQQVQFRGSPDGACPPGYDFNFSNGRCYPNGYKAPGVYKRPLPDDPPYGYRHYRHPRYDGDPGYGYRPRYYDY